MSSRREEGSVQRYTTTLGDKGLKDPASHRDDRQKAEVDQKVKEKELFIALEKPLENRAYWNTFQLKTDQLYLGRTEKKA
jgi:hypothetical protein